MPTGGTTGGTLGQAAIPIIPGGGTGDTPNPTAPPPVSPDPGGSGAGGGGGGGDDGGDGDGDGGGDGGGSGADVTVNPGAGGGATTRDTGVFGGSADDDGFFELSSTFNNSTAFQTIVTLDDVSNEAATIELVSPGGQIVLSSLDNSPPKTAGLALDFGINALTYPSSGADSDVEDGSYRQTFFFATRSEGDLVAAPGTSFTAAVVAKNDSNFSAGTLRANVFLVGDAAQGSGLGAGGAVDAAIDLWQAIYASVGISVQINTINVNSDLGMVPNPSFHSTFFLENASGVGTLSPAVNVFVGELISQDNTIDDPSKLLVGVLGISGGIPGAAIPTTRSAVVVGLLFHDTGDGVLTGSEVTVLGETMAHEVGHYLGLFHPVECFDQDCVEGDSLTDTTTCPTVESCRSNGLAGNLMFPSAQEGFLQQTLSGEQGTVLNIQTLVD